MTFDDLGLRPELLRALQDIDYREPTPIQSQAIPVLLQGRDLMACAQTGTGKTAAFALPILHRLAEGEKNSLRALILVPTRELAIQVAKNINAYSTHVGLVSTCAYGGVPIEPQEMMLRHGVDILVATPGRLIDHMWRGNIDYRHTEFLVLDEADRMLDMGFIKDVQEIIREVPEERQSMLFSATLGPEITRLAKAILRQPERIEVAPPASTVDKVEQFIIKVDREGKAERLEDLIREHDMRRAIVFARTKVGASRLAGHLRKRRIRAEAIHSNRSQEERVRTLEAFRAGEIHVLVATDIAARGIDVEEITHVVNYDVPYAAEDYVHRIGRTARAGRSGKAITFVTREEIRGLRAIERLIGFSLPEEGGSLTPYGANGTEGPPGRAGGRGQGGRRSGAGRGRSGRSDRSGRSGRETSGATVAAEAVSVATEGAAPRRRKRRRRGGRGRAEHPGAAAAPSTNEPRVREEAAGSARGKRSLLRSVLEKLRLGKP